MRPRFLSSSFSLLLSAIAVSACNEVDVGTDTGEVTDSFAKPTLHGDLTFGVANQSAFTDDERFHAWTFTLSADSDVELATAVDAQNLDTVLYLYKRPAGKTTWGSYIKKNDDSAGALTSKIKAKLGAGEYQVRVKAKKSTMRGAFSVSGACTGAGCPPANACGPDEVTTFPSGGYGPACDGMLADVLVAPVIATSGTEMTFPERCSLEPTQKAAVELYRQYFDDLLGWDSLTEDGEPPLTVEQETHEGGARVVRVEITGSDEMALDFVFDESGALLLAHHHEQSPSDLWFCGDGSGTEPDSFCVGDALWQVPHRAEDAKSEMGTVKFNQAATALSPLLAKAAAHYKTATSATSAMNLNYDGESWTLDAPDNAADVTFSATNRPTLRYVVGQSSFASTLLFRGDASGTKLVCESLD